jgi:hypothetical protein
VSVWFPLASIAWISSLHSVPDCRNSDGISTRLGDRVPPRDHVVADGRAHARDPRRARRLVRLIVYRCFAWRERRRGVRKTGRSGFPAPNKERVGTTIRRSTAASTSPTERCPASSSSRPAFADSRSCPRCLFDAGSPLPSRRSSSPTMRAHRSRRAGRPQGGRTAAVGRRHADSRGHPAAGAPVPPRASAGRRAPLVVRLRVALGERDGLRAGGGEAATARGSGTCAGRWKRLGGCRAPRSPRRLTDSAIVGRATPTRPSITKRLHRFAHHLIDATPQCEDE